MQDKEKKECIDKLQAAIIFLGEAEKILTNCCEGEIERHIIICRKEISEITDDIRNIREKIW